MSYTISLTSQQASKYFAEFTGTFCLVFGWKMIFAKSSADIAPLIVGILYMVLMYSFGTISNGHFNPSVTLAWVIRDDSSFPRRNYGQWIMYIFMQFIGGIFGGWFAYLCGDRAACDVYTHINTTDYEDYHAAFSELAFTTLLCAVVLHSMTDNRTRGNDFYGAAIGLTLTVSIYSIGCITGSPINPAVYVGTTVSAAACIDDIESDEEWVYPLAHILGAFIAGLVFLIFFGRSRHMRSDSCCDDSTTCDCDVCKKKRICVEPVQPKCETKKRKSYSVDHRENSYKDPSYKRENSCKRAANRTGALYEHEDSMSININI